MSEFSSRLAGGAHRSQLCCANSQDSILPFVAGMGSALLRGVCAGLTEVNHALCPSSSSSGVSTRKRVEELILEVDDARQENQRLNRNVQKMRHAGKAGPEGYSGLQDELMNEDAQQLKRLLKDLQHENNQLKISEQGVHAARLQNAGRTVSFTQYQNLQQQVQEMKRAMKQSTNQAGMLPSGGSHLLYSSQMPPPPRYGSRHTSGRQSPLSGAVTPAESYGTGSSNFYGQTGSSVHDPEEIRRQVIAAQQENDMLRNKVRMLASN